MLISQTLANEPVGGQMTESVDSRRRSNISLACLWLCTSVSAAWRWLLISWLITGQHPVINQPQHCPANNSHVNTDCSTPYVNVAYKTRCLVSLPGNGCFRSRLLFHRRCFFSFQRQISELRWPIAAKFCTVSVNDCCYFTVCWWKKSGLPEMKFPIHIHIHRFYVDISISTDAYMQPPIFAKYRSARAFISPRNMTQIFPQPTVKIW